MKCGSASAVNESRLKDEILLRKRAEKRANETTKRARDLEKRLEGVEDETNQLRSMLREAKEGWKTIRSYENNCQNTIVLRRIKSILRMSQHGDKTVISQAYRLDQDAPSQQYNVAKKIDSITN